jgi:molybdopterin/thiamine biosynthesis adenylyltransferase
MSTIRFSQSVFSRVYEHLFSRHGEHFAFLLASWTYSGGEPIFMVRDVILIPDNEVTVDECGWSLDIESIVRVINSAIKSGDALIEVHNHGGTIPRFSATDRYGLQEFSAYVLSSLPGRPYGATVWGDDAIYGEYFLPGELQGIVRSITVVGSRFRQVVSRDDDEKPVNQSFDRQLPWFTEEGQREIGRVRVGVVGNGGTGSQIIVALTYIGCRDFVLVDDDIAEDHSMNRLVTATPEEVGNAKALLGEQYIRNHAPEARIRIIQTKLQTAEALDALKGVDVLFGCVDNDGARLILNELALAFSIPFFDLGVEIEAEKGRVTAAGGRLAVVLPDGPCLNCMGQIDVQEARFFLSTPEEQAFQVRRGYVSGMDIKAPAVAPLNGVVANVAAVEFVVFLSGQRATSPFTEYDLIGTGRGNDSQWLTPRRINSVSGCIECTMRGKGDRASIIERYAGKEKAEVL